MCVLVAQLCPTLCDPWTVAHQAPLSMKCSGKNTGVGCRFLLQGIFPTKGLNLRLLHLQVDSFFFLLLLLFFTLQYCIGFAILQHESTMGVHVFAGGLFTTASPGKPLC